MDTQCEEFEAKYPGIAWGTRGLFEPRSFCRVVTVPVSGSLPSGSLPSGSLQPFSGHSAVPGKCSSSSKPHTYSQKPPAPSSNSAMIHVPSGNAASNKPFPPGPRANNSQHHGPFRGAVHRPPKPVAKQGTVGWMGSNPTNP